MLQTFPTTLYIIWNSIEGWILLGGRSRHCGPWRRDRHSLDKRLFEQGEIPSKTVESRNRQDEDKERLDRVLFNDPATLSIRTRNGGRVDKQRQETKNQALEVETDDIFVSSRLGE